MFPDLQAFYSHYLNSAVGIGAGLLLGFLLYFTWKNYKERRRLTNLRKQKQKERQEQLQDFKKRYPFGPKEAAIVELRLDSLIKKLQNRDLRARQVLEAFIGKAVAVTAEFNCVTEFIPQSFKWADELDALPAAKGPLHGVPFCVKEDHDIEGMDTTLGLSTNLQQPKKDTAVVVKILQDAGGIPFCKTNLPQTTLSGSSENPIFGTTLNPLNKTLSPGGSSSGTACLVRASGSPFGLGSDIGGSLRIPAHMCGVATLRPTIRRISDIGIARILEDIAGYSVVPGVIALHATDLVTVYKLLWKDTLQNQYDPLTVPIQWNSEMFTSKGRLHIGYFTSLPIFPAIGDTSETVLRAKSSLEKLGHTLLEFHLPDPEHLEKLYSTLLAAGRGTQLYDLLKHDAVSKNAVRYKRSHFSSRGDENTTGADPAAQRSEVLWKYLKELRTAKIKILQQMRDEHLDLILSPVLPFPAPKVENADELIRASYIYTAVWNLLDFPAGVIQFGVESCSKVDEFNPRKNRMWKLAKENLKLAKGMPIGVQIIGRPFKEEMVLRVMTELEDFKGTG